VSAHTPGPWISHDINDDTPDCGMWVVDFPDDENATVHRLYVGDMETNTGTDIANANLVAAAPDLLEACRLAMNDMQEHAYSVVTYSAVTAACEKATGEVAEDRSIPGAARRCENPGCGTGALLDAYDECPRCGARS
jgi:hypothetical protein